MGNQAFEKAFKEWEDHKRQQEEISMPQYLEETSNSEDAVEPPKLDPKIFDEAIEELRDIEKNGLKTGFPSIDRAILGIRDFVTIAGEPGTGKTAIALQWAIKWAGEDRPILYLDFENSKRELMRRVFSVLGNISYQDMKEGKTPENLNDEVGLILRYLRIIKPSDATITPQLICAYIRWFNKNVSFNGDVILIVDSINKLVDRFPLPDTERKDRRSMMDAWLGQLEGIKDKFNVPVIITSEVPKTSKGDGEKEVSVFTPKETGRIGYTSRIMFVLEREKGRTTGTLHLIKNQFGEPAKAKLKFHSVSWRIEEKTPAVED